MKKFTALILAAIFLFAAATPVSAAVPEIAVPFYANTSQAGVVFTINAEGSASWTITCLGKSSCTGIDAVTYLERQVGNTWVRVDLGNTNNEYTYSTTASRMTKTYVLTLDTHGTYRATVIFTVYGTVEDETLSYSTERTF